MKEDSIFYPNAIMFAIHNFPCSNRHREGLDFYFLFVILLFPLWYILDVVANILDWIGIKIFLDFPIWVLTKMEKYEKMHEGSKNVKT